jgi:hypothetical protein
MRLLSEGVLFLFASLVGAAVAGLFFAFGSSDFRGVAVPVVYVSTQIGLVVWLPMWALLHGRHSVSVLVVYACSWPVVFLLGFSGIDARAAILGGLSVMLATGAWCRLSRRFDLGADCE